MSFPVYSKQIAKNQIPPGLEEGTFYLVKGFGESEVASALDVLKTFQQQMFGMQEGLPFVISTKEKSRHEALQFVMGLFVVLSECIKQHEIIYTVDWWYRIPSDNGRGKCLVAFTTLGLTELME